MQSPSATGGRHDRRVWRMIEASIDTIVLTLVNIGWGFIMGFVMVALTLLWYGRW